MEAVYLNGVGKKIRNGFLNGKIPSSKVIELYWCNKKEADGFSSYGMNTTELNYMLRKSHNPILISKLEECISLRNEMSRKSNAQNKLNLEKLETFKRNALGIGLRKVILKMKNEARKNKQLDLKIVSLLLETEFANLCAKNHGKALKSIIYERKGRLLLQLSDLLKGSNWKYGYNDDCGKNANYLVYIYLPNDVQLCWHSNDYYVTTTYPVINCEWDGKACATMEKILDYINNNYEYMFDSTI